MKLLGSLKATTADIGANFLPLLDSHDLRAKNLRIFKDMTSVYVIGNMQESCEWNIFGRFGRSVGKHDYSFQTSTILQLREKYSLLYSELFIPQVLVS